MTKATILYHNDADGFAAALAAWLIYRDDAHYVEVRYGEPVPLIPQGTTHLYILDFSYSRAICDDLASRYALTVIDHHQTAKAELEGAPYALFDLTKAGCELAWEYFHPTAPLPELLAYVADRDMWTWELPSSREVNAWIGSLPKNFPEWRRIVATGIDRDAILCGYSILASHRQLVRMMAEGAKVAYIAGWPAIVVNSGPALVSELGEYLGELFPAASLVAIYHDQPDGSRKYSLRTRRFDVDVSAIAQQFNGGGHRKAASFILPAYSYPSAKTMGGELAYALGAIVQHEDRQP